MVSFRTPQYYIRARIETDLTHVGLNSNHVRITVEQTRFPPFIDVVSVVQHRGHTLLLREYYAVIPRVTSYLLCPVAGMMPSCPNDHLGDSRVFSSWDTYRYFHLSYGKGSQWIQGIAVCPLNSTPVMRHDFATRFLPQGVLFSTEMFLKTFATCVSIL